MLGLAAAPEMVWGRRRLGWDFSPKPGQHHRQSLETRASFCSHRAIPR
jgi:hypothetical protein